MPNWFTPHDFPARNPATTPPDNSPHNPSGEPYNWTRQHFPAVLTAIVAALQPHPGAHAAVRLALRNLHTQLHPPPPVQAANPTHRPLQCGKHAPGDLDA